MSDPFSCPYIDFNLWNASVSFVRTTIGILDLATIKRTMGYSEDTAVEMRKHRLKYVFSMFFVQKIIWVDEVAEPEELAYVQEHFPTAVLHALDLTDPQIFPPLLEEALTVLPTDLSENEKLQVIGLCFGAAASTGTVNPGEVAILQVAAEKLALSNERLFEYIQELLY